MEDSSGQTISVPLEPTETPGLASLAELIFVMFAGKYGLEESSTQTEIVFHMTGKLTFTLLPEDASHVEMDFSSTKLN
jgi:hypothetical protein